MLPSHEGHCKNLHGHSYFGDITISTQFLDKDGFVVDFGVLKDIIDRYDHSGEVFKESAEVMASNICHEILSETDLDARAEKIEVNLWETANNMVSYRWVQG